MFKSAVQELTDISRKYGNNPEYVLAGGGNTSWKDHKNMFIKGSGTQLGTISPEDFVHMDLKKLDEIWKKEYSAEPELREEEALTDLMNAKADPGAQRRPSVETLLHALFPLRWVIHTHPSLVNGITCSRNGKQWLFDNLPEDLKNQTLWIPVVNPGYILAKTIRDTINKVINQGGEFPRIIFLQNHGVFIAANSLEEVETMYTRIMYLIKRDLRDLPEPGYTEIPQSPELDTVRKSILEEAPVGSLVEGFVNRDILRFSESEQTFEPLSLSMTPDHIVYYGYKPLYLQDGSAVSSNCVSFQQENNFFPRIIVIQGLGAFAVSSSEVGLQRARDLFIDDVKIAVYAENFGGHQFMPEDKIEFIRNWEAEKYRSSSK